MYISVILLYLVLEGEGRLEPPCLYSGRDNSSGNLRKKKQHISQNSHWIEKYNVCDVSMRSQISTFSAQPKHLFNTIFKNCPSGLTFADKSLPDKAKHYTSASVALGGCVKRSHNQLVYALCGCRGHLEDNSGGVVNDIIITSRIDITVYMYVPYYCHVE